MKVVIPMSGQSSRFTSAGYQTPKHLIEIDGKKVIEHIIDLYPKDSEFVFIINDKHKDETDVVDVLKRAAPDSVIVTIPSHKKGPVHSVLQATKYIDDYEPVIVNYCDFSMHWDYEDFEEFVVQTECDGCVVCYTGFHPHMLGSDNYAFCKTGEKNEILEIREKQPFTADKMSEFASTGTYYFREGSYIKKYFQQLIDEDININGEYYVSLVHNLLIQDGLPNFVYEIPVMLQWGTPLDVNMYLQWSDYYKAVLEGNKPLKIKNCVTALPMAGAGNRFKKDGFAIPKPFLIVNDNYMVDQAEHCLPRTDKTVYACLKSHMSMLPLEDYNHVVWIDDVLEGQACTTEKIMKEIDDDASILLSACDNGVLYDSDKFADLIEDPQNDIVVWSYRNNYTAYRNPDMYSWLDVDGDDIKGVSVKKFSGGNPVDKHAIVGTMFFRNKDVYLESLRQTYRKNVRTNGEFYVDSILNEAIDLGYTVKNFEVDHYICWGTPDDLNTYRYWQNFFNAVNWHPYDYRKDYLTH
jgi:NDP-sugar pyrophosphorylase family protein|tara:strand:- start:1302 stop:2867 length:1566 start_codon:yes stop_codon:yes gene_type:complete